MILYIEIRNLTTHDNIRSCRHNNYFVLQAALEKIPISLLCKLIISLCISTHFINLIYADFDTLYVSVEIVQIFRILLG